MLTLTANLSGSEIARALGVWRHLEGSIQARGLPGTVACRLIGFPVAINVPGAHLSLAKGRLAGAFADCGRPVTIHISDCDSASLGCAFPGSVAGCQVAWAFDFVRTCCVLLVRAGLAQSS